MPKSNNPYDLIHALEERYNELLMEAEGDIAASTNITASSQTFGNTDEIYDAVDNIFSGYIGKVDYFSGTKQYLFEIDKAYGRGLDILVGAVDNSSRAPREIYPSSSADRYPCCFRVLDNKANMPLLDAFKSAGIREARNYENSQWGTYKILISSKSQLNQVFDIFEKYVTNSL